MEKAEYSTSLKIGYQQVDYSGHWRLSDVFSQLADLATIHAEKINVWRPEMIEDYGWIVSKVRIRVLKPVRFEQRVEMKTWPGKGSRVIFPRYFTITDENGDCCMEAASLWTLLDLKNRRIVMPARSGITFPENLNLEVPLTIETDFSDEDGLSVIETRQVRYSDIDTNQHLNNARYIEWTLDLLTRERFKEAYIADFSVYFKKETAPGETLTLEKKEDDHGFVVRGRNGENVHFVAEGVWKKY